jgi:hypothetical protein
MNRGALEGKMFFNVNLNIGTARYLPEDNPFRRLEAARSVKVFHIPKGVEGLVDSMVPDHLVTDDMVDRYLAIRPPLFRVRAAFDPIIEEIERAYVLGHAFSSLSASVVAIERMLNEARIQLHEHETSKLKRLWGKGPVNDWVPNITALRQWDYIEPKLSEELLVVYAIRCRYLHSGPIDTLEVDSPRCVNAAFAVLTEFIGFPERLFRIIGGQIECLDESHPLFKVFYRPSLTSHLGDDSAG